MPSPIVYSNKYALTLTLMPIYCKKNTLVDQYSGTINIWYTLHQEGWRIHRYVCGVTQSGNLHYHAIVSVPIPSGWSNTKVKFTISEWFKKYNLRFRDIHKYGYTCVKDITDYNAWDDYLTKNVKECEDLLGTRKIDGSDPKSLDDLFT